MIQSSSLTEAQKSQDQPIRVADYIASTVEGTGSEVFFMLSGGMMMHLMDAFGRTGMRYYCNHHEQACAMAADAYARVTGRLGVCLATSGPGATNLLTGLVGAYQDSVPVLFLTGQCKRKETVSWRGIEGLRQCGFLEVDIVPIVKSVTKYAAFIDEPSDIRYHLEKAIHLATTGRPGPVLLDVPLDVQGALVNLAEMRAFVPEPAVSPEHFSRRDLQRVIDAVQNASRPILLAGHGVRSAGLVAEFRDLVGRWQVPVISTMMAKDLLPENHPLLVGQAGQRGNRGANLAIQAADVIVAMGCSFHLQTVGYEGELFAPNALKIQIDIDPAMMKREDVGAQWKFNWDLHDYLPLMTRSVAGPWSGQASDAWRLECHRRKHQFPCHNEPHALGEADDPLNLYEFIDLLSEELTGEDTILTDAGQPFYILPQALRLKEGQRYLVPGSLAEMGWAVPASIGVATASPVGRAVGIVGDGSLQTNIQELQTIAHHQLNIKLFIVNNGGYASIRNTQNSYFKGFFVGSTPESGVTLPAVSKIAAAYGLPYVLCENRSVASERIHQVLQTRGPVICEVISQINQRVMPVVPSFVAPDGRMRSKALHEMDPGRPTDIQEPDSTPLV
ncbi:MAG: thiamine pyrophosphate-binding protein [Candidatus Solibacter sp.]